MSKLDEILEYKKREVARKKDELDLKKLRERITPRFDTRSLAKAIKPASGVGLIAEIKKASPSAGVIREDFRPTQLARDYESGGANALSVLTDEPYFQGHLRYLLQARSAVGIPCLRKDFVVDEYQIWEARLAEADAVLLIVAALSREELVRFMGAAREAALETLVEVHDEKELEIAIEIGAPIIGVNNRNLKTFTVDLAVTECLVPKIPKDRIVVSESGIFTLADVARVRKAGCHAILVGESLMRQADVTEATRSLLR
jgi:indole-3-glycerol phosphate synthase